jgi:hypothetical protein
MGTERQKDTSVVLTGDPQIRYTYGQFLVFDSSQEAPGCQWDDRHWNQGFSKRESIVSFSTLERSGKGKLLVVNSAEKQKGVIRAIRTSIYVPSGKLCIEGVDEFPISRYVSLVPGIYRITASQGREANGQLLIFISVIPSTEIEPSEVIVADDALDPHIPLLETSEVP